MADRLVLVNGLPGSGKTTLARELAGCLSAPLVSKDSIKETLAELVPSAPGAALGAIAMETVWSLAAVMPGLVVVESWWFKPRDEHHARAGVERCRAAAVVEVWCEVPAEVARRRYETRRRHPVHEDVRRLTDSWPEWAARAEPLGMAPTIRVTTAGAVPIAHVASEVVQALGRYRPDAGGQR